MGTTGIVALVFGTQQSTTPNPSSVNTKVDAFVIPSVNTKVDASEIDYLRECNEKRKGSRNLQTVRVARPWRLADPVFVDPSVSPTPDDLCSYSLRARRVMLTGAPLPASTVLARATDPRKVYTDGHFPSVTAANGATVTYAAQWWTQDATPAECVDCWEWLGNAVRHHWRDRFAMLHGTPATTGRDLFARSLDADVWPVMSPEAQHFVRLSGGQGRMETYPAQSRSVTPLYEYDARMCYVSLLHELPVGEPEPLRAVAARDYAVQHPYSEARYKVSWKAPDGWRHPGILPARNDTDTGTEWHWPLTGDGWCGGAELFTARRHGWDVSIAGALVWHQRGNPLGRWRDRLLRILAESETTPELTERERVFMRGAIRAMILHTVGAFHGTPRKVTRHGTAEQIPDHASGIRRHGNGWAWIEREPNAWPEMVHPEWSVTVWGRARARILSGHRGRTGMLTVDPTLLVGARTDAVYLTRPVGWEMLDKGLPGQYRLRTHPGGVWPRTGLDIVAMRG